jgi:hypothetical protein
VIPSINKGAMQEKTKQLDLQAFQEEKRISWDDFAEKEIFFDIKDNDRDIQLRNVLADLIQEGLIMPVHGLRPAWVITK